LAEEGNMQYKVGRTSIKIVQGDITEQETEAIVNAANPSLMGGGGVDGAIHRKGGPSILEECKKIRATQYPDGLPTGKAVITTAGKLKAKYVIHTVGPIWRGGGEGEADLLAQAYRSCLELAASRGIKSIAFPSISTGAYGYPIAEASRVALRAIKEFLEEKPFFDEVVLVLFSKDALKVYEEAAAEIFGGSFS
jgi:O-acetyl-ADP-ribose deacetylase (regulator of RNase III)